MADQIVEFFNKLAQADPARIFTATLLISVIADCLAVGRWQFFCFDRLHSRGGPGFPSAHRPRLASLASCTGRSP